MGLEEFIEDEKLSQAERKEKIEKEFDCTHNSIKSNKLITEKTNDLIRAELECPDCNREWTLTANLNKVDEKKTGEKVTHFCCNLFEN